MSNDSKSCLYVMALPFLMIGIMIFQVLIPVELILIRFSGGERINGASGGATNCAGVNVPAEYMGWTREASSIHLQGDEAKLIALIEVESGWNATASNPSSSAAGLGQFVTKTAKGYYEFTGGHDKSYNYDWPKGIVYDNPDAHSDDARFDAKRAIFAVSRKFKTDLERAGGDFGLAYEKYYHTWKNEKQHQAALAARQKLENYYLSIKSGGCQEGAVAAASGVGSNNVPIYQQCDTKWGEKAFGTSSSGGKATICTEGCGPTAAAMVLAYYNKNVDPPKMANEVMDGYRAASGTEYEFFPHIATQYGLKSQQLRNWSDAMNFLKQKKPVIVSGKGAPPFTEYGHFVVLTSYNSDGTIGVNDPAGIGYAGHKTNYSYPEANIRDMVMGHRKFMIAIYP